jgi:hypothetical protein
MSTVSSEASDSPDTSPFPVRVVSLRARGIAPVHNTLCGANDVSPGVGVWSGCSVVFADGPDEDLSSPEGRVERDDDGGVVLAWMLAQARCGRCRLECAMYSPRTLRAWASL